MRAITVSNYGARPSITELPTPQAGPGQVLIAVQAAGMNPMDRGRAAGADTGRPRSGRRRRAAKASRARLASRVIAV